MSATLSSESGAGIDPELFKRVFRQYPAGVVVVTVDAGAGPAGFTATSLSSLSIDPPLLSFGISARASSWPHVRDAATAVVNFLAADQHELARRFATSGIDRFAEPTRWRRLDTGEPVLADVPGWLRVSLHSRLAAGDHHIVVARIEDASPADEHRPLVYHDGRYHSLGAHSAI